ncbi:MAG: 50S ribosomal protein L25 [Myxococcota bacterium]
MESVELAVEPRVANGKGNAHKVRAAGLVPAVVYGKGFESRSISLAPVAIRNTLKSKLGFNSVIKLNVAGESSFLVMLKEVQRHPVSREIIHIDFLRIHEDAPVTVSVPLRLEGRAEGVVAGGTLKALVRTLNVRCLPANIPTELKADVTSLKIADSLQAKSVPLDAGVTLASNPNTSVATVEQ